jgi:hypothetical protein
MALVSDIYTASRWPAPAVLIARLFPTRKRFGLFPQYFQPISRGLLNTPSTRLSRFLGSHRSFFTSPSKPELHGKIRRVASAGKQLSFEGQALTRHPDSNSESVVSAPLGKPQLSPGIVQHSLQPHLRRKRRKCSNLSKNGAR